MDAVAGLLDGPRARGAFLLRSLLDPPWAFRIEDEAPLSLVAVLSGRAWVCPDHAPAFQAATGDLVIFRGPDAFVMADQPGRAPQVAIGPNQQCRPLHDSGRAHTDSLGFAIRTWGNATVGDTAMLTGTYRLRGEVPQRLLRALPSAMHLPAGAWSAPIIALLADEITRNQPGQEAVLDRLLDLLLISALRNWFDRPEAAAPGWYRAAADPIVGHALRLMHHNPDRRWTVAELAHEVGTSRTVLSRRFRHLVGEPPMTFLTDWRLTLAADLLLEPDATIASVARQVGYSSPFALSTAFKRHRGVTPQQHRIQPGFTGASSAH